MFNSGFYKLAIVLATTIYLTACATISKEQCQLGDWYQVGLVDGQTGKQSMAADYNKDCAEHGVKVALEDYKSGRSEGLKTYCRYDNAVLVGERGEQYENVCPAELAPEFLSGYTPYYKVAKSRDSYREARIRVAQIKESLKDESLSKEDAAELKANYNIAKEEAEQEQERLDTHEYELAMHKLDRELAKLNQQIANAKEGEKPSLLSQKKELEDKKQLIEDLHVTEQGIKTIKEIIDLF